MATGIVAALLIGGVGLSYASRNEPVVVFVHSSPSLSAGPSGPVAVTPSPPSASPITPTPSGVAPVPPGPSPTMSRSVAATRTPARTPAPSLSPSASTSPPPPVDSTPPSVEKVAVSPTELDAKDCPYGEKSSTVSAIAYDNRTPADTLRVSFQYTLNGASTTVAMSHVGRNLFRGTLGNLPLPSKTTQIPIPIYVTAVDSAGNRSTQITPIGVTLFSYCTQRLGDVVPFDRKLSTMTESWLA